MSSTRSSAADHRDRFESRTFQNGDYRLPYRLLKPKEYVAKQKYPLVIFLHGAGERGDDNEKQLVHGMNNFASDEVMDKYPAFVFAPQCPLDEQWGGINRLATTPTPPDEFAPALAAALKAGDSLRQEFPIDERRIYITGLSCWQQYFFISQKCSRIFLGGRFQAIDLYWVKSPWIMNQLYMTNPTIRELINGESV